MEEILGVTTQTLEVVIQAVEVVRLFAIFMAMVASWLVRRHLKRRLDLWYQGGKVSFDFRLLAFSEYRVSWHGRVHRRRFSRWLRNIWIGDNVWRIWARILLMILASLISFLILNWVVNDDWWPIDLSKLKLNSEGEIAKGAWTLVVAIVSSPVAFMVWWFRDSNQRQQLDNQRKDTNLKDFQQLAQWASGLHCEDSKPDNIVSGLDTSDSMVYGSTWSYFDKRAGANSLQIAAIYQLQSFLRGDYGKYFQQPAFALLKSIWVSLTQSHVKVWQKSFGSDTGTTYAIETYIVKYESESLDVKPSVDNQLIQAIARCFTHDGGIVLRQHEQELAGSNFVNLDTNLGGHSLELERCNLSRSNWQYAHLQYAFLEGANLSEAQMQGANMEKIHLEGADMRESNLEHANLERANMEGAYIRESHLEYANLKQAYLKGACMEESRLEYVNLAQADLEGADMRKTHLSKAKFIGANLYGVNLSEAHIVNADMRNTRIIKSNMSDANFERANMIEANLEDANLTGANLTNVDLSDAHFRRANFTSTNLEGAKFINPTIDNDTNFFGARSNEGTKILVSLASVSYLEAREAWENGDYSKFDKGKSLELRVRLRDENNLVLPDIAYKEL